MGRLVQPNGIKIELNDTKSSELYSEIYRLFDAVGQAMSSPSRHQAYPVLDTIYNELYEMGIT